MRCEASNNGLLIASSDAGRPPRNDEWGCDGQGRDDGASNTGVHRWVKCQPYPHNLGGSFFLLALLVNVCIAFFDN